MKPDTIDKEVLDLILGASKNSHPNEFAGILRSNEGRITEVLLLPGTFSSERSAVMRLHMVPVGSNACGTVHSHPKPSTDPSRADLELFNKFGEVHIIAASPYKEGSWSAYDYRGDELKLKVRDYK